MSIADVTENNILKLIFNATAWTNVASGDATGVASPITTISVALHTADPGDAGTQTTSESTYSAYARVSPARTTGGWTASSAGSTSPVANIDFPSSGAAGTTISFFSTGKSGGGATDIYWSGTVTPNIAIGASGVIPRLTTASTITLD
jgi:hypothetical protein